MMERIRALLVEDDQVLASIVRESLDKSGFEVYVAGNGVVGWEMYKSLNPDICVIDVGLPRKDGFALLTDIRTLDDRVLLVLLSGRTQTKDVLKGLTLGADDYIRKPFSIEELILRLKALLRRRTINLPEAEQLDWRIGKFRFRPGAMELLLAGKVILLSRREADLLLLLVQRKNQLLERRQALVKLWGDEDHFSGRSMDVYITRLRRKLKADPTIQIVNRRGRGYVLIDNPGAFGMLIHDSGME